MIFRFRDLLKLKIKFQSPFYALAEFGRVLHARIRGFAPLADAEVEEKRLETCRNCTFLDHDTDQCTICTCWVPAKVQISVSKCPKGFWGPVFIKK